MSKQLPASHKDRMPYSCTQLLNLQPGHMYTFYRGDFDLDMACSPRSYAALLRRVKVFAETMEASGMIKLAKIRRALTRDIPEKVKGEWTTRSMPYAYFEYTAIRLA